MEEILKLDVSNESVVLINRFLNKTHIDDEEHAIVLSHLFSFYCKTSQLQEIQKLINEYVKKYNKVNAFIMFDNAIELIIDKDKELCLQLINQKKTLLASYENNIYYKDMILYYKDNFEERIKFIDLFLQDDTSKQSRLQGMMLLASAYFDNKSFNKFQGNLDTTKELALELAQIKSYELLRFYEASDLYLNGEFDIALNVIKDNKIISNSYTNEFNLLRLKIYFKKSEYRKCSILEAEYEEAMESSSVDVRKDFYNFCIELYTILNNQISIKEYKAKLDSTNEVKYTNKLNTQQTEEIKSIKIKKEQVVKEIETPLFKNIKKVLPSLNEMNDFYQESSLVYKPFYIQKEFREQLRLSLIELNLQVDFTDCYIITKDFESFHFKKERLYFKKESDKKIIKVFKQDDTEIISFNTKQDNLLDPFDKEILKENFATIIPLFSDKCFGVIYFLGNEEKLITGKLNYEKLHSFAKFYNALALSHYNEESLNLENRVKVDVMNAYGFYYAYTDMDFVYINNHLKRALEMNSKITLKSFFSSMTVSSQTEFIEEFKNMDVYFEKQVEFSNEKIMLIKATKINDYKIVFIFEDYTVVEQNKEETIKIAFNNPITGLKNNQSLNVEIHNYFEMKKFSAVLVNFKDLKKYTYLYKEKFSLDILKYLGDILPKFNLEYDYYHLNFDKLIVLIKDVNDKRILKQIITKLDLYLLEKLGNINHRLVPKFSYGTYRSMVDTKEKSLNKVLEILSDSILNADDFYDGNIGFYDVELYKKRFLKEQLVTYVSESIDQKNVNILFSQCVNVKDGLIEFYESKLNLNRYKVEDELFKEVIKNRNLTTKLEQYLIQRTFHEMNLIHEKTDFSINVIIEIDEYSLIKSSFINYLDSTANQFKIDKNRVILKINKVYEQAVENIGHLIMSGYKIALVNIDDLSLIKPNYFLLKNFKNTNQFNDEYIKSICNILTSLKVNFVLANTTKNQQIEHYKQYINCFMGDIYNQQLTYLDIINIFKQSTVI